MPDLILILRTWNDNGRDTWWTRTIGPSMPPEKGDGVVLWGTRDSWLSVPVVNVQRRTWLPDGAVALTLEMGDSLVRACGGSDVLYGKLRDAEWRQVDA